MGGGCPASNSKYLIGRSSRTCMVVVVDVRLRAATHLLVSYPVVFPFLILCDRKVPMLFQATALCADRLLCAHAIAQAFLRGGG